MSCLNVTSRTSCRPSSVYTHLQQLLITEMELCPMRLESKGLLAAQQLCSLCPRSRLTWSDDLGGVRLILAQFAHSIDDGNAF